MSHDTDNVVSGLICERDLSKIKEAVCIQVEKIYDQCKEKDCIENARVIFRDPEKIQKLINKAINVKVREADVVYVYSDIEEVPFKRGFFTVDVKFFIKVTLDFFVPTNPVGTRIVTKRGLITFDKKVILFGSEGNVKIFKTHFEPHSPDHPYGCMLQQDNLPISKVEVAEPIALNAKFREVPVLSNEEFCMEKCPKSVLETLEDEDESDEIRNLLSESERRPEIKFRKVVEVTVGLFSIIKLVRFVQLQIPAFGFCIPQKHCIASTEEEPCELFETIDFPLDEFFPPQICSFPGAREAVEEMYDYIDNQDNRHKDRDR